MFGHMIYFTARQSRPEPTRKPALPEDFVNLVGPSAWCGRPRRLGRSR